MDQIGVLICTLVGNSTNVEPEFPFPYTNTCIACSASLMSSIRVLRVCSKFAVTDCDVIMQIMRETLIYLSHLDHEDTEQQVI